MKDNIAFLDALQQIAKDKGISVDVLLDAHGDGLINFLVGRGQRRVLADQNASEFLNFGCGRCRLQRLRCRGNGILQCLPAFQHVRCDGGIIGGCIVNRLVRFVIRSLTLNLIS